MHKPLPFPAPVIKATRPEKFIFYQNEGSPWLQNEDYSSASCVR